IDIDGFDDEKYLAEYGDELLMHLATLEGEMITEDYYPDKQPHLSSSLRGEAYNWLLKLNAQLRVPAETLLVTMNILDRFLAIRTVDERAYWLAFFTALRLACKYTTIKMPDLKWCEQICFKKFTRSEFLTSEAAMLKVLKFRLSCPTAHNFLSRFSKVDGKPDDEVHTAAKAIAQISCLDVGFIGYRPSAIATASVFLARKALSRADWDPMEIGEVTGYVWGEVKGIYDFMLEFLRAPIRHHCFFAPARAGEPVNPIVGIRKWALKT
ncbi:cyclin-like protein, partial [Piedraia hortae CBS 480.64]